jgi:hypothetical protein
MRRDVAREVKYQERKIEAILKNDSFSLNDAALERKSSEYRGMFEMEFRLSCLGLNEIGP